MFTTGDLFASFTCPAFSSFSSACLRLNKVATISVIVNRRDVPNNDAPLHLAAKLGHMAATEMLMVARENNSLKQLKCSLLCLLLAYWDLVYVSINDILYIDFRADL
ncbi:hypothetical protein VNO77_41779 [Canavalia gladiata]|uniref:Uncharacterized protein n=1 Tax=Canavalia gladiata TaxID=3824 RepID=A0AAN9PQG3_CANGL